MSCGPIKAHPPALAPGRVARKPASPRLCVRVVTAAAANAPPVWGAGMAPTLRAKRNDVLSVARLQRPRTILVLDQGSVPAEGAERS